MSLTHRISAAAPDAAINQAVAEHVAGWTRHAHETSECYDSEGNHTYWSNVPDYCGSADSVLPLLEKQAGGKFNIRYSGPFHCDMPQNYEVNISRAQYLVPSTRGMTFARTCCIALLAANGFTIDP